MRRYLLGLALPAIVVAGVGAVFLTQGSKTPPAPEVVAHAPAPTPDMAKAAAQAAAASPTPESTAAPTIVASTAPAKVTQMPAAPPAPNAASAAASAATAPATATATATEAASTPSASAAAPAPMQVAANDTPAPAGAAGPAATAAAPAATDVPPASSGQHSTAEMLADRVLGDPNAPVTILEYASLTCPHCAHFDVEILPLIKKSYIDTGKAKLIFRDYPFDAVALRAAMLARCTVPERYFGFLDVLYRSQTTWGAAQDPMKALAQTARLADVKQKDFDACMANEALLNGVVQKRMDGEKKFGVDATPTFIFLRGDQQEKIVGAQPFPKFAEVLDKLGSK